jgi:hypothetical protein
VAAQQDRRGTSLELAGFVVAIAGLAILARGVWDASPIVFWYTDAEIEAAHQGREIMLGGTSILAVAALLLAVRGRLVRALAVAAPAAICTPLAYEADPGTGWAAWLFLPLAFAALTAAVPRRPAPGELAR